MMWVRGGPPHLPAKEWSLLVFRIISARTVTVRCLPVFDQYAFYTLRQLKQKKYRAIPCVRCAKLEIILCRELGGASEDSQEGLLFATGVRPLWSLAGGAQGAATGCFLRVSATGGGVGGLGGSGQGGALVDVSRPLHQGERVPKTKVGVYRFTGFRLVRNPYQTRPQKLCLLRTHTGQQT